MIYVFFAVIKYCKKSKVLVNYINNLNLKEKVL